MNELTCPYCDSKQDFTLEDDSIFNGANQHECDECGKNFIFTAEASVDYYSYEAECLNGGGHDWEPPITYPRKATRMQCKTCGEYRDPTPEEMAEILKDEKS